MSNALAVNDTNLKKAAFAASADIFRDKFLDIFGIKMMKIQYAVDRVFNGVIRRFRHVINLTICPLGTRLNLTIRAIGQGSIPLPKLVDEIYYMQYTYTQLNVPVSPLPTYRTGKLLLKD